MLLFHHPCGIPRSTPRSSTRSLRSSDYDPVSMFHPHPSRALHAIHVIRLDSLVMQSEVQQQWYQNLPLHTDLRPLSRCSSSPQIISLNAVPSVRRAVILTEYSVVLFSPSAQMPE
jgi:hypothetical protein